MVGVQSWGLGLVPGKLTACITIQDTSERVARAPLRPCTTHSIRTIHTTMPHLVGAQHPSPNHPLPRAITHGQIHSRTSLPSIYHYQQSNCQRGSTMRG